MNARPDRKKLFLLLSALVYIFFSAIVLIKAYQAPLFYDEAYNASVAKNLAYGLGVSTSYHQLEPANPRISTGPLILIPTAIAILSVGNELWVPAVTTAVINLFILLIIFLVLRKEHEPSTYFFTVLSLLLCSYWYEFNLWIVMMGEVTATLLLILAIIIYCQTTASDYRHIFIAGLAAGLSVTTKTIMLIPLTGAVAYIFIQQIFTRTPYKSIATQLFIFLLATTIPLIIWKLYLHTLLAQLTPEELSLHNEKSAIFFNYLGSGIGQFKDAIGKIDYLQENFYKNLTVISSHFQNYGLSVAVTATCAAVVFLSLAQLTWRNRQQLNPSSALLIAASAHLLWFIPFSFSFGSSRYLFPAICMLLVALVLANTLMRKVLFPCLLILVAVAQTLGLNPNLKLLTDNHENWRVATQEAVEYLKTSNSEIPMAGCGWDTPRQLEYALTGSLHFKDCLQLLKEQVQIDSQTLKLNHKPSATITTPALSQPLEFKFVRNKFLSSLINDAKHILTYCDTTIWENDYYDILYCRIEKLSDKLTNQVMLYKPMN